MDTGHTQEEQARPALWIITFADMMSLLMCFFVLLLSFAEMDVARYQQIVGSMSTAFNAGGAAGVRQPPLGNAVAIRDIVPVAAPTPIGGKVDAGATDEALTAAIKADLQKLVKQTQDDAGVLAAQLASQITNGEVEIETRGRRIILRIRERGSFGSGSADLKPTYQTLMHEMRDLLATKDGQITVQGHTDDVPIATDRFRSNWELSSARAVSVAQELLSEGVLDPRRFTIAGYADTRTLVPNSSDENRARNRRVEIVISQGVDQKTRENLGVLKEKDPEYYRKMGLEDQFRLDPSEVF